MEWWAWLAVGVILLGSELAFVDAQFYLVFVGSAALVVGFLDLGEPVPVWLQWSIFMTLAAVSMVFFRRRIYERLRRNLPVMQSGPTGGIVIVPAALAPGGTCRLEYHGSSWSARNSGRSPIAAGGRARIERVDGVTLIVQGEPTADGEPATSADVAGVEK
jgi:membrane protein implicated in regulation of membrane protease activity